MKKIFEALKSVRLAVGLIAYLALTGMLATLLPQGRGSRFFTSILFLLPAGLFFVNLAACSIDRFVRELRRPTRRRHGPDILHLGLLLLVVGAVLSFSGRQTGSVNLAKGDQVEMPGGRLLVLEDFARTTYPDGRPRDWVSTVRVERGGREEVRSFPLRVNHPLRLGRISIYQSSYAVETFLAVTDPTGAGHLLGQGGEVEHGGTTLFYMARAEDPGQAVVRIEGSAGAEVLRLPAGGRAGSFVVDGFRDVDVTGLQAVIDPGYPLVLAALALITIGVFVTMGRKIGDMKP